MSVAPCLSLHLGAMLATFGELTEFRVLFNGNQGSVTLMYGDKIKMRQRRKKQGAPVAAKGVRDQNWTGGKGGNIPVRLSNDRHQEDL